MTENQYIICGNTVDELLSAQWSLLKKNPGGAPVFKRYFLSNKEQIKELPPEQGAVSYIVQPPLNGAAIAVWMCLVCGAAVSCSENATVASAGGLEHIWTGSMRGSGRNSYEQTVSVLNDYSGFLRKYGCTVAGECARTWFFVNDIDRNYQGMVVGRRELFEEYGLNRDTHYIASTGICGTPPAGGGCMVQMDAYAVKGHIAKRYLYAPTHLNPTSEYGVTFERGVRLDYDGKAHVMISGTASIDNRGNVLYEADPEAQTMRIVENVEVLLKEAGALWKDMTMAVVYLRNREDYSNVMSVLSNRLEGIPHIFTLAPVCRPQWLVEMECMAVFDL